MRSYTAPTAELYAPSPKALQPACHGRRLGHPGPLHSHHHDRQRPFDDLARAASTSGWWSPTTLPSGARGRPATVQVLLNAANANTAQMAQGYVEGAVASLNRDLAAVRAAVELRTAFLYNPGLVNAWFVVTGVFGTLIILNGSLVSAATMRRSPFPRRTRSSSRDW